MKLFYSVAGIFDHILWALYTVSDGFKLTGNQVAQRGCKEHVQFTQGLVQWFVYREYSGGLLYLSDFIVKEKRGRR